jgi:hypothetical protein
LPIILSYPFHTTCIWNDNLSIKNAWVLICSKKVN